MRAPRSATATAETASRVLRIDHFRFLKMQHKARVQPELGNPTHEEACAILRLSPQSRSASHVRQLCLFLGEHPPFAKLPWQAVEEFASLASLEQRRAGQHVYYQDDAVRT